MTRRLRPLLGALAGLGLAVTACRQPPAQATAASPADEARADRTPPASTLEGRMAARNRRAPVLTDAALRARTDAQRYILGRHATLFEDESGKPIPWIPEDGELQAPPAAHPGQGEDVLANLPGSSGLGGPEGSEPEDIVLNGNTLGRFTPIERAGEEPVLMDFYEALRALRRGEDPDGKVRVLVYGASHTDADVYPHYLRRYLQQRFGNGGHGFIQVAKPWAWYHHFDMGVDSSRHWRTDHAQRRGGREDGFYGLLGASVRTRRKYAKTRIYHRHGSSASHYEFYFLTQPKGGSFRIRIDGKRITTVSTRGETFEPGYHALEVEPGQHEIELQTVGHGEVRLFGMTAERDQPGVVVDTLGIGGTRAANMLKWDQAIWSDNVRRRDPSLYMLAYGTNEATDADQPIQDYAADLRAVLERLDEIAPDASCLLVGPGDFPDSRGDDRRIPRPRLSQIVETQRRVAGEMGCGFWDALEFMGGEMSMPTWVQAKPQMAKDDHIHLTRRGYVRMGMALTDALMLEFDATEAMMARARRMLGSYGL